MKIFALPGYILGALICVTASYNLITMALAQPAGSLGFVDWLIITGILAVAFLAFSLYLDEIITNIKERK